MNRCTFNYNYIINSHFEQSLYKLKRECLYAPKIKITFKSISYIISSKYFVRLVTMRPGLEFHDDWFVNK